MISFMSFLLLLDSEPSISRELKNNNGKKGVSDVGYLKRGRGSVTVGEESQDSRRSNSNNTLLPATAINLSNVDNIQTKSHQYSEFFEIDACLYPFLIVDRLPRDSLGAV
jgi:hypothetical protein